MTFYTYWASCVQCREIIMRIWWMLFGKSVSTVLKSIAYTKQNWILGRCQYVRILRSDVFFRPHLKSLLWKVFWKSLFLLLGAWNVLSTGQVWTFRQGALLFCHNYYYFFLDALSGRYWMKQPVQLRRRSFSNVKFRRPGQTLCCLQREAWHLGKHCSPMICHQLWKPAPTWSLLSAHKRKCLKLI